MLSSERMTAAAIAALLGWLGGCLPSAETLPAPIPAGEGLDAQFVVQNANRPAALAFAPDGRLFYTERASGLIRVVSDTTLRSEPFASVPVNSAGDRGLNGIALHPDFARNGRVYVFYSRADIGVSTSSAGSIIDHRIVYFEALGDVASGGEVFVASLPLGPATTRLGGRIAFARDGTLLVGFGDQTDTGSPQTPGVLGGKILRYNDDGSIPADNPNPASPVFATGVADVRGLTVDPLTGLLFIVDRTDGANEEVHRVNSGANLGWPAVAGVADTTAELDFTAANAGVVDPLLDTRGERLLIVGGGFNPSTRYGVATQNHFFYGETTRNQVTHAAIDGDRAAIGTREKFAGGFPGPITDVAFSPAGTLYIACENAILRLAPRR